MDRVTVKDPGETSVVVTPSRAPARPAQAALTAKASTRSLATLSPASAAAVSSSRTARQLRPIRLRARLASTTRVISAAAQAIHACHRVSGKVVPRNAGVLMLMPSPWSPPNVPVNRKASDGRATASMSVTPARYGPRSRAAATPTARPATAATAALAASTASSGQARCSSSSAAAYAPTAMKAPFPIEI